MCYVNSYDKEHVTMLGDASSGRGRPMKSVSSKNNFTPLVTQLTFLKIGFNALMTIIIRT